MAVKEEVDALRAQLAECNTSQWQRACALMENITTLMGHRGGPMGAKINPRACRVCGYFGHTKQFCPVAKRQEDAYFDEILNEEALYRKRVLEKALNVVREPYDVTKSAQAKTFDELGLPYTTDPDLGALISFEKAAHRGAWTYDSEGCLVRNTN